MSKRPSRAKMNNWLADQIRGIRIIPSNPMDTKAMAENGKVADRKLRHLANIASEMGWGFEASLDFAWELIADYEKEYDSGGGDCSAQVIPTTHGSTKERNEQGES